MLFQDILEELFDLGEALNALEPLSSGEGGERPLLPPSGYPTRAGPVVAVTCRGGSAREGPRRERTER